MIGMDNTTQVLYTTYRDALAKRKERMIEMRRQGKTYAEIGRHFGLTRQRVHIILAELRKQETA